MIRFWPRRKDKETEKDRETGGETERPDDRHEAGAESRGPDAATAPAAPEAPLAETPPDSEATPEATPEPTPAPTLDSASESGEPAPVFAPEPETEPVSAPEPTPDAGPAGAAAEPAGPGEEGPSRKGWLFRLREGLSRSSSRLTDGITGIFTRRKLDDETLEELEELLITADLGPTTAAKVTQELARTRFGKEVTPEEVRRSLAAEIAKILEPVARPLTLDPAARPHVILVVGVNGTGKTTTIGKLAKQFRTSGKSVTLAAGDTFRAAAVSQLRIWGERTGCPVVFRDTGADAAGLAFDALEKARREGADVLLIDTAGRLQNKANLMAELQKIIRVLKKLDPAAPHSTLLTLDATTGQNAHAQVEVFREMVQVGGLILTKLDGSARGGVLVSLAEKFELPVHAIGVGEGVDDLRPFEADAFARSLMGLEV